MTTTASRWQLVLSAASRHFYLWIEDSSGDVDYETEVDAINEGAARSQAARRHGYAASDFEVSDRRPSWWPGKR